MNENEPIEAIKEDGFLERVMKKSGHPLPPNDPVVVFWEEMLKTHKNFCEDIKNKNMMAVAEALLTQQRFLKGYQKTMEHGLDYVVERFGTQFVEKLNSETLAGLKRNEALIRDGMNEIFGQYQQHLRDIEKLKRVVIVLLVLAAIGVGCLYALIMKLVLQL